MLTNQIGKVISIFSAGHSGSTLLALILGAHPRSFYVGEFHALPRWINEKLDCGCGSVVTDCSFWDKIRNHYNMKYNLDFFQFPKKLNIYEIYDRSRAQRLKRKIIRGVTYYELNLRSDDKPIKSRFKFWDTLACNTMNMFQIISENSKKDVIVDSTKSYLRTYSLYNRYPKIVKVLVLVRDGRAVSHSYKKRGIFNFNDAAKKWKNTYNHGLRIISKLPKRDVLMIKYENLCRNPVEEIQRITKFLDLQYDNRMLDFSSGISHSIAGNDMKWSSKPRIELNEKWKKDISRKELNDFDKIAGKLNTSFGYSKTIPIK
jgi:hypothetical protein